jgi:uncharacterized protein HemY
MSLNKYISSFAKRPLVVSITYRVLTIATLCALLLMLAATSSHSQALMVDKAYTLLNSGNLEKSREAIDIAAEHPNTKKDARTLYLRSFIYKELALRDSVQTRNLRSISIQSALRCLEVDSTNRYSNDCSAIISNAYTSYLNEAIVSLNKQEYTDVFPSLKPIIDSQTDLAKNRRPEALFYYGYALLQMGNQERAREYLFKALQSGYQDPLIYEIEFYHRITSSQKDSAQWYLREGKRLFPTDPNLNIAELNLLMKSEEYGRAEKIIEHHLAQNPNSIEGLLLAGTVYEKLLPTATENNQYFAKQTAVYKRILKMEPNHLQANYNLGIAYYNQGVNLINGASENYDLELANFNRLLEQCSSLFLTALPYLEKVHLLDSTHVNALKALEGVYYNINDYENYNLVKSKLQKL